MSEGCSGDQLAELREQVAALRRRIEEAEARQEETDRAIRELLISAQERRR